MVIIDFTSSDGFITAATRYVLSFDPSVAQQPTPEQLRLEAIWNDWRKYG